MSNLRKAKQGYFQRCEDHNKAHLLVSRAEEEQAGTGPGAGGAASKTLDKRRRVEEEAKNKVRAGGGDSAPGQAVGPACRWVPAGPDATLRAGLELRPPRPPRSLPRRRKPWPRTAHAWRTPRRRNRSWRTPR